MDGWMDGCVYGLIGVCVCLYVHISESFKKECLGRGDGSVCKSVCCVQA